MVVNERGLGGARAGESPLVHSFDFTVRFRGPKHEVDWLEHLGRKPSDVSIDHSLTTRLKLDSTARGNSTCTGPT